MSVDVSTDGTHAVRAGEAGFDPDDLLQHLARNVPLLSREQEQLLARRIEAGDERARQRFIEANIRLVVAIARAYRRSGVPLSDIIQEGIIGLIQAVDHYDWRKGTRFSTCATLWIKQSISRAMPSLRHTIRIPPRVMRDAGRLEGVIERLSQELQRSPTERELEVHITDSLDSAEAVRKLPFEPLSLDSAEDERRSFLEAIADPTSAEPEASAVNSLTEDALLQAFECLTERERQVLSLRFGLAQNREHTLGEIGDALGLSRQRVKQIEGAALHKLRRQVHRERDETRWIG